MAAVEHGQSVGRSINYVAKELGINGTIGYVNNSLHIFLVPTGGRGIVVVAALTCP